MTASKPSKMSEEQNLYPHDIYRINRSLQEIKDACGIKEQLMGYSQLNFLNRKFSNMVVHQDRWAFNKTTCNNIIEFANSNMYKENWMSFLKGFKKNDFDHLSESISYLSKVKTLNGPEDFKSFHFHLIYLFQSFTIQDYFYLDGIIYRNCKKGNSRLSFATGDLLIEDKATYRVYPWVFMKFHYGEERCLSIFSSQELKEDLEAGSGGKNDKPLARMSSLLSATGYDPSKNEIIYLHYLIPLFAGYPDPDGGDFFCGKYEKNQYLFDPDIIKEIISKYKYLFFIPVYDAYIGDEAYGNIVGNITVPFTTEKKRDEFSLKYQSLSKASSILIK